MSMGKRNKAEKAQYSVPPVRDEEKRMASGSGGTSWSAKLVAAAPKAPRVLPRVTVHAHERSRLRWTAEGTGTLILTVIPETLWYALKLAPFLLPARVDPMTL